jgi:hypothetical protein
VNRNILRVLIFISSNSYPGPLLNYANCFAVDSSGAVKLFIIPTALSYTMKVILLDRVSLTNLGVVAFQNTLIPSVFAIWTAQLVIRVYWLPILCILVLILSKGILAYLFFFISFASCHQKARGGTHTVNTPLPAPATNVAVVPPICSGQATLNLSLIALNVANLTAELVACLHNTGVQPLHKLNTPSLFTTCEIILGKLCLPRFPPEDASWITRVLRDSPGVTTNTLSVTPAHRPDTTFMAVVLVDLDTRVK